VWLHEEFIGFIKSSGFKDFPQKKEIGTLSSLRLGLVLSNLCTMLKVLKNYVLIFICVACVASPSVNRTTNLLQVQT